VAGNPIQSAGRRFVAKFGVSFAWALLFSALFGGLVFFRVPRSETDDPSWHAELRLWLERLELLTYDWRARALGDAQVRADGVVLLALDDETLANAREAADLSLSVRPWPRDLLGALMQQAVREGAKEVMLDMSVADISPRQCGAKGELLSADDDALRRRIESQPGRMMLTFRALDEHGHVPDRELKPFLLKVGDFDAQAEAREPVRHVLSQRAPAYLLPKASQGFELWAAALSEAKAKELAQTLELKGAAQIRPESADDPKYEVDAAWLLESLATVDVDADLSKLPRLKAYDAPVPAVLTDKALLGASNVERDVDGRVRALPLLWVSALRGKPHVIASAALRMAMESAGETHATLKDGRLTFGKVSVPVDDEGYLLLRWDAGDVGRGSRGSLKRSIPLWRLALNLGDDESKRGVRRNDNELDGRMAIISDTSGIGVPTPIGRVQQGAVLGQAVDNLISGTAVTRQAPLGDFNATAALAFAGAFVAVSLSSLFRRAGWLSMAVVLCAVLGLYALVARQMFIAQGKWVAMAGPMLAFTLTYLASLGYATTIETSLREFLRRALGAALPTEVAARLESNVSLMKPERRSVAVYLSDVEGFTELAHQVAPETYVQVLQDYLGRMTRAVLDTQGSVDKYLGDGVMAFWGAPVHLDEPAQRACEAALQMAETFDKRRAAWEKRCRRPLDFRAGIDFGEALVGEMGTEHRAAYTVMGEPVAAAARLEALARGWGVRVLVTEAVVEHCDELFVFRELDRVRFPRRVGAVRVFELVGRQDEVPQAARAELAKFTLALKVFHERRFKEARGLFAALKEDAATRRYALRATKLDDHPPSEAWDGTCDD
jgi:adenylate cyclase